MAHHQTPIISDQVSIPDGVVEDVAEIGCEVGDVVEEGHVAVIIETHKACLNVKATGARTMRVVEILASVGDEVKESDPLVLVRKRPGDRALLSLHLVLFTRLHFRTLIRATRRALSCRFTALPVTGSAEC